jgi:hypothetical protein
MNSNWNGAEILYHFNDESHSFELSDTQFAIIIKILGLTLNRDGSVSCYSDLTLNQLMNMNGNPLKLVEK